MNLELIVSTITASICVIIGLFVYLKNGKSATNRYFAFFTFFLGLYSLFNFLAINSENNETAFLWSKFVMLSLIPIGPLFFLFVKTFPSSKEEVNYKTRFAFLIWGISMIPLIGFNFVFQSVELVGKTVNIIPGPAIALFMTVHIGAILFGSFILIQKYRSAKGSSKVQLEYITFGLLTSLILTVFATAILGVLLKISILIPISPLFLVIAALAITYAIVKHRFFDIRLIVARAVAYILLVVFIGLGYIAFLFDVVILLNRNNPTRQTIQDLVLPAILAVIFAISFQPLRRFFERITDRIFYKDHYDANTLLWDLSRIMASTLYLAEICKKILENLLSAMRVSYGSVVLVRKSSIIWVGGVGKTSGIPFRGNEIFELIQTSYKPKGGDEQILIYEELPEGRLKNTMREHAITLVLPLSVRDELIGGILLGEKSSGEIYSSEDIDLLKILAPEVAVAVKNALAYEEIKRFNVTLEDEVHHATQRLRNANHKLKELDNLKDEFVSIASHELRTPMTAIKSYLWMALNQPGQDIKEPLKKYLNISYASTERLIRLVNDMLTVSRIERNKIELKLAPIDVYEIAKAVYDELKVTADERKIHMTLHKAEEIPYMVNGDKEKLREVFQNIVGNALKFVPADGSIKIEIAKHESMVKASVADTGPGIPKDSMSLLFKKFSKIEYSYAKHSNQPGTGLGLYISKQIVSLHNGDIQVQSEVNVGTTFTVLLPLMTKPISVPSAETKSNEPAKLPEPETAKKTTSKELKDIKEVKKS